MAYQDNIELLQRLQWPYTTVLLDVTLAYQDDPVLLNHLNQDDPEYFHNLHHSVTM